MRSAHPGRPHLLLYYFYIIRRRKDHVNTRLHNIKTPSCGRERTMGKMCSNFFGACIRCLILFLCPAFVVEDNRLLWMKK